MESECESELTDDEDFTDRNEAIETSKKNIDIEFLLQSLWKSISPPTKEEDVLQQWYGCIYQEYNKTKGSKKQVLFAAKATPRFLSDENGKAYTLEMESFKSKIGRRTIFETVPQHLGQDISLCPLRNIIAGLLEVIPMKNN